MELKYLLQQAITNIQNLQEYYEHQIEQTELYVNKKIEKYKYGVILDKYFFNKLNNGQEMISDEEQKIIDEIVETYRIEEEEGEDFYITYKLKSIENYGKKYIFNPRVAVNENMKLKEQPIILNNSTLMMLIVRYEEVISGIFRYIIMHYPEAYLKDKTITYSDLMKISADLSAVKGAFMDKQIDEFMRLPVGDWYALFQNMHKVKFMFENDEFERFKEVYYRRNIVVHNQSVVNDIYINNVKEKYRNKVEKGDILQVGKEYMSEAFSIIKIILYGTFLGLKKLSNDIESLEDHMFDLAYSHMINEEWNISEYVYGIMKEEKNQTEANCIYNRVNYWISVKNQGRFDEIKSEIEQFDVTAMSGQFKVAKYALLNDFDSVNDILEEVLGSDIQAYCIEEWPLFIQYRKSKEYKKFKQKHAKEFDIFGYKPEYIPVENEEDILNEFEDEIEKI